MSSEKWELPGEQPQVVPTKIPLHVRAIRWFILLCAGVVFYVGLCERPGFFPRFVKNTQLPDTVCYPFKETSEVEQTWARIRISSESILWQDCYDNKLCAKYLVPMDYSKPDSPAAIIALVKVPAQVPPGSDAYRGPILFNPGGPGGSGVDLIAAAGELLQTIIGEEYDIVGFDPRGVGRSEPKAVAFTDPADATAWTIKEAVAPLFNATPDAMAQMYARTTVFNDLEQRETGFGAAYMSTAAVARDMLKISKAEGFDRIQYWGFSYGTVLGATFAAMFPDNIERLIIDGVEDPDDYYSALWSNNLVDTDNTLRYITKSCVDAGPEGCALYESTPEKVEARLHSILDNLKRRPIAVIPSEKHFTGIDYGVVDYGLARKILFMLLYQPYHALPLRAGWAPVLATAFSELEKGNGLPMWDLAKRSQPQFQCSCPQVPSVVSVGAEALVAIACGDGDPVEDTVEELEAHLQRIAEDSSFADVWSIRARCVNWKVRPAERFTGPFEGNTSFPLLLIGNDADPVTPLRNAHKVSRGFKDSVVLKQNSAGHCSLAAPSLCVAKAIRAYFRDGKLPEPGTACDVNASIFAKGDEDILQGLSGFDRDLLEAWNDVSALFKIPKYGLVV